MDQGWCQHLEHVVHEPALFQHQESENGGCWALQVRYELFVPHVKFCYLHLLMLQFLILITLYLNRCMRYDAQVSHRAPVLVMETVLQISSKFYFTVSYFVCLFVNSLCTLSCFVLCSSLTLVLTNSTTNLSFVTSDHFCCSQNHRRWHCVLHTRWSKQARRFF